MKFMLTEENKRHMNELPLYMHDGLKLYLEEGIPPGSFLTAIICNDLMGAFAAADETNMQCIDKWVRFFYWHVPSDAWGSSENMQEWMTARRAERKESKEPIDIS